MTRRTRRLEAESSLRSLPAAIAPSLDTNRFRDQIRIELRDLLGPFVQVERGQRAVPFTPWASDVQTAAGRWFDRLQRSLFRGTESRIIMLSCKIAVLDAVRAEADALVPLPDLAAPFQRACVQALEMEDWIESPLHLRVEITEAAAPRTVVEVFQARRLGWTPQAQERLLKTSAAAAGWRRALAPLIPGLSGFAAEMAVPRPSAHDRAAALRLGESK